MLPNLIVSIIMCVFLFGMIILTSFAVLFASVSLFKINYSESEQSDILATQGLFDVSVVTFGLCINFLLETFHNLILFYSLLILALQSFFTVIKYSLFKELGEEVYVDLPYFQK